MSDDFKRGFAFTATCSYVKSSDSFVEDNSSEMFFNFEDVGGESTEARKFLKGFLGSILTKRVEARDIHAEDAFKILKIAESLTNDEAMASIHDYLVFHDNMLRVIEDRHETDDVEHVSNYFVLSQHVDIATFNRCRRTTYLHFLLARQYDDVRYEFSSMFS